MIDDLIQRYVNEGMQAKLKLQSRLFTLFVETTGHRPEDLCLVEQQIVKGTEYKTIYYFDWKQRHQTLSPSAPEAKAHAGEGKLVSPTLRGRNEMITDDEIEKELDSDIDLAALFCDNMNYAAAKHCYKAGFRKCEAMMREKVKSEKDRLAANNKYTEANRIRCKCDDLAHAYYHGQVDLIDDLFAPDPEKTKKD